MPARHAAWLAVLLTAGLIALPVGAQTQTSSSSGKGGTSASSSKTRKPPASTPNTLEAADIAELRGRIANREVSLLRRSEVSDAAIEVWLHPGSRQYYVGVSLQGVLRRTLKSSNEAEAWLGFDSFRRLAALGEVGRPVLLGQMGAPASGTGNGPIASATSSAVPVTTPSRSLTPRPSSPAVMPGQDLRTVVVTPEQMAAPPAVDATDLAMVEQARNQVDPNRRTVTEAAPPPTDDAGRSSGQAVDTLRRARLGDDVVRLVWNADSAQYLASLTRQGKVMGMLRTADGAQAARAYEEFLHQAEARAAVMPKADAASSAASAPTGPASPVQTSPDGKKGRRGRPDEARSAGPSSASSRVAADSPRTAQMKAERSSKATKAALAKAEKADRAQKTSKPKTSKTAKATAPQRSASPPTG